MKGVWRVDEVRVAEEELMATLPEGTLMRRAATGLATRAAARLGKVYGSRVLLLVGAGNNGGDALYAGASLAGRGAAVEALLLRPERAHTGGLRALLAAGGRAITRVTDLTGGYDLILDGIVGIGGRGGLRPDAVEAVRAATGQREEGARGGRSRCATVIAVDVPSGIDVDTGAVTGEAVQADVTVTFGCLKPGLLVGKGATHAGEVELIDIGLGTYLAQTAPVAWVPEDDDIAGWWPQPEPADDKYSRGVVGIAAGSARYTGAAVLAVSGASAGPAGFVRYAGQAAEYVRRAWPTAVISDAVATAGRVSAWVVGPGLGVDERAWEEVRQVLDAPVPVCVDADGLTLLANRGVDLTGRQAPTVLTPHDREFARFGLGEPGEDRIGAARALAARLGVTVLLKGNRTVVANPTGPVFINPTGTPALASAGTGDVLAGLIGALLAAGLPADRAAIAGAYLHGLAGRYAAERGPVTAIDVAHALRPVINSLLRRTGPSVRWHYVADAGASGPRRDPR